MSGFNDVVLAWLIEQHRDTNVVSYVSRRPHEPAEVLRVTTDATDWEGDTEDGFYGAFDLGIVYVDTDGETHTFKVPVGEQLESLWMHVVGAWPEGRP